MRAWPDEDDPPDVHGLAADPYTSLAAVQAELTHLGELREAYRRSRWAITELWIVVVGLAAIMLITGWWVLALPVVAFALLAVHQADGTDVSTERGHELDTAIADARERYWRLLLEREENE